MSISLEFQTIQERIDHRRDTPGKKASLERFTRALQHSKPVWINADHVILVGGTNGKGSIAKTLEHLISASGKNVGLFTSPHLMSVTERIHAAGRDINETQFVQTYRRIEPTVESYDLSHFEILTLMAVDFFFSGALQAPVDWAVFEVGVGGALDPTRLIPHSTNVIAPIALDHKDVLGPHLSDIANAKFGMVGEGEKVIHYPYIDRAILDSLQAHRSRLNSEWIASPLHSYTVQKCDGEPKFIIKTPWGEAPMSLPGARAIENTSLALTTLSELGFAIQDLLPQLKSVFWPGRMEKFVQPGWPCPVYLSGDHNVQGAQSLRALLEEFSSKKIHLIVGIGKKKEADEILQEFSKIPRIQLYLTRTPFRGGEMSDYGPWLSRAEFADPAPLRVLEHVLAKASASDRIVVTGSLYLVGAVRRWILGL